MRRDLVGKMKTIDEVIVGLGICARELDCNCCREAVHYLMMYKELTKDAESFAEWKENPPLTFDEVYAMIDKPVWMEWYTAKGWRLVNSFYSKLKGEKAVALTDRLGVDFVFGKETFENCEVKVYRKEHHEDAG